MAVMTQLRPTPSKTLARMAEASEGQSVVTHLVGRLIQIPDAGPLSPTRFLGRAAGRRSGNLDHGPPPSHGRD